MKKDIKGDLAVAISEGRKKVRFKAGTEMPDKVNTVVIDVEEVEERDGSRFVVHVEFTSTGSVTDASTGSVTDASAASTSSAGGASTGSVGGAGGVVK